MTDEQLAALRRDGYVVIPGLVPRSLCQAVIDAICEFTGVDCDHAATWYNHPASGHGIVPLHHHQALWDVRQHPAVHGAFAEIYGRQDLWVSMDRASYKPPAGAPTADYQQSAVHWDTDPWQPQSETYQGVVYLTDTEPDQGAFACVPAIYRELDTYLARHADDSDRRTPVFEPGQLQGIGGTAGSLVVFSRLMPHTSLLNRTRAHRFVQYVAMAPAGRTSERDARVADFNARRAPAWALRQAVPGQCTPEPGPLPSLSALGRRLVGLDNWNAEQQGQ